MIFFGLVTGTEIEMEMGSSDSFGTSALLLMCSGTLNLWTCRRRSFKSDKLLALPSLAFISWGSNLFRVSLRFFLAVSDDLVTSLTGDRVPFSIKALTGDRAPFFSNETTFKPHKTYYKKLVSIKLL